jgi:hypothetical protein
MPIGNAGTFDEREHEQIDSQLCYSPSLEAAVKLILGDPAFVGERETPSFKFIRAARFLKDNAPHVFQIREMHTKAKNRMDRWLWDLLDWEYRHQLLPTDSDFSAQQHARQRRPCRIPVANVARGFYRAWQRASIGVSCLRSKSKSLRG